MAAECDAIGEDDVILHHAIVGHVAADHEEAMAADAGLAMALHGTDVHGRVLADDVVVADDQLGGLVLVLQVLRREAQGREGMHHGLRADRGMAVHHHMRHEVDTLFQHGVGADHAIRTDPHIAADFGRGIDQRGRVDPRNGPRVGRCRVQVRDPVRCP